MAYVMKNRIHLWTHANFLPITLLKKKKSTIAIWLIFPMTRKAEFKSYNSQLIYMIFLNGTKCKRNGS